MSVSSDNFWFIVFIKIINTQFGTENYLDSIKSHFLTSCNTDSQRIKQNKWERAMLCSWAVWFLSLVFKGLHHLYVWGSFTGANLLVWKAVNQMGLERHLRKEWWTTSDAGVAFYVFWSRKSINIGDQFIPEDGSKSVNLSATWRRLEQ